MNASLKVRLVFWATCVACFLVLSALSQWALGFSVLTPLSPALRALKKEGGFAGELFPNLHFLFSIYVPWFVAVVVCRALGCSLARRVESPVARGVLAAETLPQSVELRSYAVKTMLQTVFWIFVGMSVLALLLGFALQTRGASPLGVWFTFVIALALAGVCGLASRAKWQGKFVAVADAEGVECLAVGSTRLRVRVQWPEIEDAVRMDNFNLFGTRVSSQMELRDEKGERRVQILLSDAPPPQQEQFALVIARYLPTHLEA